MAQAQILNQSSLRWGTEAPALRPKHKQQPVKLAPPQGPAVSSSSLCGTSALAAAFRGKRGSVVSKC